MAAATAQSLKARTQDALKELGRKGTATVKARRPRRRQSARLGNHGIAIAPGRMRAALGPPSRRRCTWIRSAEGMFDQTDYVLIKDIPPPLRAGSEAAPALRLPPRRDRSRHAPRDPARVAGIRRLPRQTLNSRYRKRRRGDRRGRRIGGVWRRIAFGLRRPRAAAFHELYGNVRNRASVRPVTAPESYLPPWPGQLGPDRFRCTLLRRGTTWPDS